MGYDNGYSFHFDFLNQIEFHLVQNRMENCHHAHIPFSLKGIENIVFSVRGQNMPIFSLRVATHGVWREATERVSRWQRVYSVELLRLPV